MRHAQRPLSILFVAFWVVIAFGPANAQSDAVTREIQTRVESLTMNGALRIGETPVVAKRLIADFYVQREFRPGWSSQANIAGLLDGIERSATHGLDPEDFHFSPLGALLANPPEIRGADTAADLDILLTDAVARLAYAHYFGKTDPVTIDDGWNFDRPLLRRDPAVVLDSTLAENGIGALIEGLELADVRYRTLIAALATYRRVADQGGWPQMPSGPALKPGSSDPRVPVLRARLAVTEDWQSGGGDSSDYDAGLESAVMRFQERHGLDIDGVIGPRTLEELNVPAEARIDQIRVNLERARWVLRELGEDFVAVNIAGFTTSLYRGGDLAWRTRSIVGREYRKTPVFRDDIRYMDFNPTWTVPPGILGNDVIPKAREDLGYIAHKGFDLFDRDGNRVDPGSIDWANAKARGFPYRVVQPPGPNNALGLVKFMFPNAHSVYLHDTPGRDLFGRSERTFSSGCVRVEDPFHFAELLLHDKPGWTREKIDAVVESGKTTTVHLENPLPVLLLYWTAWVDADGEVQFRRDIYKRDGRVLDALDGAFEATPVPRPE